MIAGRLSSGTEKITEIGCICVITTIAVGVAGLHVVARHRPAASPTRPATGATMRQYVRLSFAAVDLSPGRSAPCPVLRHQEALVVDLLLRDRVLFAQRLVALQVGLRLLQQALVARQRPLRLLQRHLVRPWIDLRQEVAHFDELAFLEADLGQLAVRSAS